MLQNKSISLPKRVILRRFVKANFEFFIKNFELNQALDTIFYRKSLEVTASRRQVSQKLENGLRKEVVKIEVKVS
jgi:hypothetical protein